MLNQLIKNKRYEILTPNGFVDFDGIQMLKKKTKEIIFENGSNLRASYNHKIYDTEGNEIFIRDVFVGDKIKSNNGFLIVGDIIDHDDETYVYDIINAGEGNLYYTNGIVSHNCNFLGSGDNVFDSELMHKVRENYLMDPIRKLLGNALWIWKEPVEGHRYLLGADISRGDSEDYSSMQIIDFDTREQVLEFVGKVPPDTMAEICYKWASAYSAFVVIDITGGMGVATSRKMQEMGYKNMYVDGIDFANKWKYDPKAMDKIPGLNFNNKRVQIIAAFEEAMRHDFRIYSNRLFNEMNTFIYINGRPDHQKGHHDDLIMSIAMAIYVAESSFANLTKVTEQAKAMLNSWSVENNQNVSEQLKFNPGLPNISEHPYQQNSRNATMDDYMKYKWLFGGK